jgi:hypothetical protein
MHSYRIVDTIELIAAGQGKTEQQVGVEGEPLAVQHILAEVMAGISVSSASFFNQKTSFQCNHYDHIKMIPLIIIKVIL